MKKSLLVEAMRVSRKNLAAHPVLGSGGYLHWSFIVQRNSIVAYGTNNNGIPPNIHGYHYRGTMDDYTPKTHAEYAAFRKAVGIMDRTKPFGIINVRLTNKGIPRISCPCSCCSSYLKMNDANECYFTTDDGWAKTVI